MIWRRLLWWVGLVLTSKRTQPPQHRSKPTADSEIDHPIDPSIQEESNLRLARSIHPGVVTAPLSAGYQPADRRCSDGSQISRSRSCGAHTALGPRPRLVNTNPFDRLIYRRLPIFVPAESTAARPLRPNARTLDTRDRIYHSTRLRIGRDDRPHQHAREAGAPSDHPLVAADPGAHCCCCRLRQWWRCSRCRRHRGLQAAPQRRPPPMPKKGTMTLVQAAAPAAAAWGCRRPRSGGCWTGSTATASRPTHPRSPSRPTRPRSRRRRP
jgi:hypothetical protein